MSAIFREDKSWLGGANQVVEIVDDIREPICSKVGKFFKLSHILTENNPKEHRKTSERTLCNLRNCDRDFTVIQGAVLTKPLTRKAST